MSPHRTRRMCGLRCRSQVLHQPPGHRSTRLGPERLAVDPERSPPATSTTPDDTPAAAGEPTLTAHSHPQSSRPRIKVPILDRKTVSLQSYRDTELRVGREAWRGQSIAREDEGITEQASAGSSLPCLESPRALPPGERGGDPARRCRSAGLPPACHRTAPRPERRPE
jgi:hypothetical protein